MSILRAHSSLKDTSQTLPTLQTKMGFNGNKHSDPIRKAERSMTAFDPNIRGDRLYDLEEFSIVHKGFETEEDKQRRQNESDGCGDLTNAEICIRQDYVFYEAYNDDDDWLYDDDTYARYQTYSDDYIQMVENGEIDDTGLSCRMGAMSLGASLEDSYDDELEADYQAEIDLKEESAMMSDADEDYDGEYDPEYETAADAYFDNVEASNDPQFGEGALPPSLSAKSSEPKDAPAITSSVNLSGQFAKATVPPIEDADQEPVANRPVPVAANNSAYQLSA